MKVLCINDSFYAVSNRVINFPLPKMGEIYTVTNTRFCKCGCGIYVFELLECQNGAGFDTECFVPISDIDETEMERNYKKEELA